MTDATSASNGSDAQGTDAATLRAVVGLRDVMAVSCGPSRAAALQCGIPDAAFGQRCSTL